MLKPGVYCACVFAVVATACGGESADSANSAANHAGSGGEGFDVGSGGASGAVQSAGSGATAALDGADHGSAGKGGSAANGGNGASGSSAGHGGAGHGGASQAGSGNSGASNSGGSAGATVNPSGQPFKGVANSPCAARTALNVSWYYNWMQSENEPCKDGKGGEFVPMIWGHMGAEQSASGIQSAIASIVGKGYRYVLGFNEPDNSGQANLSTTTAISLLPGFDVAQLVVGTPATQANTTGQTWFKDYMAKLAADTTLRNDFIAIHWYGWNAGSCDASASQLESYIKYAEGFPGNRPIWITEWSCLHDSAPTKEGVLAFYKGALAVFAKHPRLQRYAWYPWTPNCELNEDSGALTALGEAYAAAPALK
jgi:hypothetical protein